MEQTDYLLAHSRIEQIIQVDGGDEVRLQVADPLLLVVELRRALGHVPYAACVVDHQASVEFCLG